MLLFLMVMDVVSVGLFWNCWDLCVVWVLIFGGISGVVVGVVFISYINDDVLCFLIGVIFVGFVIWSFVLKCVVSQQRFLFMVGYGVGFVLGFMSFVLYVGGLLVVMYLLGQKLDKIIYYVMVVLVFWVINVFKVVFYGFLGFFIWEMFMLDFYMILFVFFGVYLGVCVYYMVLECVFFGLIYMFLVFMGMKLIWDVLI